MDINLGIIVVLIIIVFILLIIFFKAKYKISALYNELFQLRIAKSLDEIEITRLRSEKEKLLSELRNLKSYFNIPR